MSTYYPSMYDHMREQAIASTAVPRRKLRKLLVLSMIMTLSMALLSVHSMRFLTQMGLVAQKQHNDEVANSLLAHLSTQLLAAGIINSTSTMPLPPPPKNCRYNPPLCHLSLPWLYGSVVSLTCALGTLQTISRDVISANTKSVVPLFHLLLPLTPDMNKSSACLSITAKNIDASLASHRPEFAPSTALQLCLDLSPSGKGRLPGSLPSQTRRNVPDHRPEASTIDTPVIANVSLLQPFLSRVAARALGNAGIFSRRIETSLRLLRWNTLEWLSLRELVQDVM
ncbi:hypothetical protein BJV78DRAFT_1361840 [Lactifluus subvellereus]|nr:hypothetical protein BJV78DRAFT_1361840 [Lactifluus subvellereus]